MNKLERFFKFYRQPRQKWYAINEIIFNWLFIKFPKVEMFREWTQWCWIEKWVKQY